jgi:hypothetical protein
VRLIACASIAAPTAPSGWFANWRLMAISLSFIKVMSPLLDYSKDRRYNERHFAVANMSIDSQFAQQPARLAEI